MASLGNNELKADHEAKVQHKQHYEASPESKLATFPQILQWLISIATNLGNQSRGMFSLNVDLRHSLIRYSWSTDNNAAPNWVFIYVDYGLCHIQFQSIIKPDVG